MARGFREDEKESYMLWERCNLIENKGTEAEEEWEERKHIQVCTMPNSMGAGMEKDTHKYREKIKQRMWRENGNQCANAVVEKRKRWKMPHGKKEKGTT